MCKRTSAEIAFAFLHDVRSNDSHAQACVSSSRSTHLVMNCHRPVTTLLAARCFQFKCTRKENVVFEMNVPVQIALKLL